LSQAHNTGAYLSIYSGYHWQRLYLAVDTLVGFTRPIFTSYADSSTHKESKAYFFSSVAAHIGLKLDERDRLFFIYLAPRIEGYRFSQYEKGGFTAGYVSVGPSLFNRTTLTERLAFEANLGIAPFVARRYMGEDFESMAPSLDGSYRIDASIGLLFKRSSPYSKRTDFYVRLNGTLLNNKSYIHSSSLTQPASKDYALMLECGMVLENLFR
ncbi:hypothetical protein, partial [uncultured Helicobacter sp.]